LKSENAGAPSPLKKGEESALYTNFTKPRAQKVREGGRGTHSKSRKQPKSIIPNRGTPESSLGNPTLGFRSQMIT